MVAFRRDLAQHVSSLLFRRNYGDLEHEINPAHKRSHAILAFMSMINTTSECLKSRNSFTCVTGETKDSDIECVLGCFFFQFKVL